MRIRLADKQRVAEVLAALELGNERLGSSTVTELIGRLSGVLSKEEGHFLLLQQPGDRSTIVCCCSAQGSPGSMVEDRTVYYLEAIDPAECPNCRGGL